MSISILRFTPEKTAYEEGDIINFTVDILNRGVAADYQISIFDIDEDRRVANLQGTNLQTGHRRIEKGVITYMPSESMNVRIDVLRIPLEEGVDVEITDSKEYVIYLTGEEPTLLDGEEITPPEPDVVEEIPVTPEFVTPSLPLHLQWLAPIVEWLNGFGGFLYSWFGVLRDNLANIGNFFKDPVGSVLKKSTDIGNTFQGESSNIVLNALKVARSETPQWKTDVSDEIEGMMKDYQKYVALPEDWTATGIVPDSMLDKVNKLNEFAQGVQISNITWWLSHVLVEGLSLGQVEAISQVKPMVIDPTGINEIAKLPLILPLEPSLIIPAKQYYNSVFTPNYPSIDWLIQMVVKEKIEITDFQTIMSYEGIPQKWSQLIWEAHFMAPNFGQLLLMKRRGLWTDEQLTAMQILVDYDPDPKYKEIWEQNWYTDPSTREARYMYELGAIDGDGVEDVLRRRGLVPEYIQPMKDYLTGFETRLWRRRWISELAKAYGDGEISEERLRADLKEEEFRPDVADWIIKYGNLRLELKPSKVEKMKPLLNSMLFEMYSHAVLDRSQLLSELQQGNYSLADAEYIVSLFDARIREDELRGELKADKEELKRREAEAPKYKPLPYSVIEGSFMYGIEDAMWLINKLVEYGFSNVDAATVQKYIETKRKIKRGIQEGAS